MLSRGEVLGFSIRVSLTALLLGPSWGSPGWLRGPRRGPFVPSEAFMGARGSVWVDLGCFLGAAVGRMKAREANV
eukprot:711678-Pyramimonas_sp.AAC.1